MARRRKEENQDQETMSDGETIIEDKPKKQTRKKSVKVAPEEVAEKLDILFSGIANLFKSPYSYSPDDFMEEGKAVTRLSEKIPYVASIISIFDPLIIAFGLWRKLSSILPKKDKKIEQKGGEGEMNANVRIT